MARDSAEAIVLSIGQKKARVGEMRARARALFEGGAAAVAVAAFLSEQTDGLVVDFFKEVISRLPAKAQARLEANVAVVAVGGTGRGEISPYSDLDLLFLYSNKADSGDFQSLVAQTVQAYWDAGLKLGHAVRTPSDSVSLSRNDPKIATTLIESRLLWGSETVFQELVRPFRRRIIDGRKQQFVQDCISAREPEGSKDGVPAQELEPDVKSSNGGLRDLHLIRWIGYALFGVKDIDSLRMKGALTFDEARALREAWEYLTRIRIDMHFAAGKAQDRLTRDEQLRLTESMGYEATPTQRAVEVFMQEYFRHTSSVAQLARRFAALHRTESLVQQARNFLVAHRADKYLRVSPSEIDVAPRHFGRICKSLESMLRVYRAAAMYRVRLSGRLTEAIKDAVPKLEGTVSEEASKLFLDILRHTEPLGVLLRGLFDTRLLDVLIPDFGHVRNLMQFNQYHHFTVDEHTLRAVELCTRFEGLDSPLGAAYAHINHKELLHLAIILHDLGKGFGRPHADVGREISQRIAQRLHLPTAQGEVVIQLVHQHLEMAHVAFRRDISDPTTLVGFAHKVGAPDILRMLYVLTAADISAVGPAAWTEWKAELLADLFEQAMVILGGAHYGVHEQERLKTIARQVSAAAIAENPTQAPAARYESIEKRLESFPSSYRTGTSPATIREDLEIIENLDPEEVHVRGTWNNETGTVEYRIMTANPAVTTGCFHKLAGALTARRLEILAADIATTTDGIVVDAFRILDRDYASEPPPSRIQSVANSLRDVLFGRMSVEALFVRNRRFGVDPNRKPFSDLPLRVLVDSESSEHRTIIDVFAHDRPGLLYATARNIFELGLSVDLAKIATHFDQVVDVFYVLDVNGQKIVDPNRLAQIRETLCRTLEEFDNGGYRAFVT